MLTANLRKVGGSIMVAIPPALLDVTEMHADMEVALTVTDGGIVIRPKKKRRYSLSDLVKQCNPKAPEGNRDWVDAPMMGDELL